MPRSTVLTLKLATWLGLIPSLAVVYVLFWPGAGLISTRGYYLGQDFVNFWSAGRFVLDGRLAELYDRVAYDEAVRALFAPASGFLNFSYPPHSLLLLWPLAVMPYAVSLALWQALGVGGFLALCLAGSSRASIHELAPVILLSPLVILVVSVGQASFFLALLFVGAFRLLPTRPIVAGILFGVLTIKPQLGILVPPALLLLRAYRAFTAASVTTLVLVGLSLAIFGVELWRDYIFTTLTYQQRVITEMVGLYPLMMVTPYAGLWWLGVPSGLALVLHGIIAILVGVTALAMLRRNSDWALSICLLALAAVLATPYCLNYDLAIVAATLLNWLGARRLAVSPYLLGAIFLFWISPVMGMLLVQWGVPVLPFVVLALFVALVYGVGQDSVSRPAQATTSAGL